ncbi:DUF5067 domain-containing protein [Levilactobacillus wangkuiensis]|uniref:DUF5067 domain-containing protein n=1 Tax=Levilactobacillus wangkuiensis TaxID=2799566 RepID=UPI0019446896|nr:DUF5067 domain-containing protein [Levilactobacillus wangkuiensis]
MSHVKLIAVLGSVLLLAGCGAGNKSAAKTPSSQQEPASSRSRQSSSAQSSHTKSSASASSSTASVTKTATFSNQTFTIKNVAFKLTGSKITASATANRNLFVLYYTVTNHQNTSIIPSDLWQAAVSATQNDHKLGTGNLAFTTSQTSDNNKLNRTVMPVKAGQSVSGLAMFEPKGSQTITVTFKDTHGQTVHTSTYPAN